MTPINTNSTVHEFVHFQAKAIQALKTNNAEKNLDKGIWFPTEYLDALQAAGQQKRVDWVKDNNLCQKGYIRSKCLERIKDKEFVFVAKTGVAASKALKEITEGLALLECGTALQLSLWIALKDYIGFDNFDTFLSLPGNPLYLQHGAYILSVLYQEVKIQGEEEILPGDLCYFKNISKYPQKHPIGSAIGYNTVCVLASDRSEKKDEAKFMGFDLRVDGSSSSEIESDFFEEYNKKPRDPSGYFPEALAKQKQSSIQNILTWEEFQQERSEDKNGVSGRLILKVRRPRLDRIEQLKAASPNEIGKLLESWKKS